MLLPFVAAVVSTLTYASSGLSTDMPEAEQHSYPGNLELSSHNPLAFTYRTSQPHVLNWIGLYLAPDGEPKSSGENESPLKWSHAPDKNGSVLLALDGIAPGLYKAHFFARGGHQWLSEPVYFSIDKESAAHEAVDETSRPGVQNWNGQQDAAEGGPKNGVFNRSSIDWAFAPDADGSVNFGRRGLGSGQYKVYSLTNNGYTELTVPAHLGISESGNYSGSISVGGAYIGTPLRIKYATSEPGDLNRIGIYAADQQRGRGPVNEVLDRAALSWEWATEPAGHVSLPTESLSPGGVYKVFFLAADGFKWLAEPKIVRFQHETPFDFIVKNITTKNAKEGDEFTVNVGNLLNYPDDEGTTFSVRGEKSWATVSSSGIISGTPPTGVGDTLLEIEATNKAASSAILSVRVPVRPAHAPLVENLRVMSYNLWFGGIMVKNYHEKQVRFLIGQNVDIVAFQESFGGHGTRLAHALGWHSWEGFFSSVSVISRYPITEVLLSTSRYTAVRIALDGSKSEVLLWNAHLGYDPYGPYDFCFFNMSQEQVLEREAESGRTSQIQKIVRKMRQYIVNADDVPVFLAGDFNAPSHLDWTDATSRQHCDAGAVPWPTSTIPTKAGLIDSFRVAHPNPVSTPGITWSPIVLINDGGEAEPLDRIDFIYHKGRKLAVQSSETLLVGNPKPEPDHEDNEWTSDHYSLLTTYSLQQ